MASHHVTSPCTSHHVTLHINALTHARADTEGKLAMAEVECCREADLGVNDNIFFTRTHLGNIIHPGDTVLGYDLANSNFNNDDLEVCNPPPVLLLLLPLPLSPPHACPA